METCCGIRTALRVLAFCGAVGVAGGLASAQTNQPGTNKAPVREKVTGKPVDQSAKKAMTVIGPGSAPIAEAGKVPVTADMIARGPGANLCAAAPTIGEGVTAFSNVGATTDGPSPCGLLGNDVWFNYVASASGTVTISACGQTAIDTVIAAWDGAACPPTVLMACDDDFCAGFGPSQITFAVVGGNTYKIQLGDFNGGAGQGTGTFTISLGGGGGAANDTCATATPVGEGTHAFDLTGAVTDGAGDPSCDSGFGNDQVNNDVYFAYTATITGPAAADLCGQTGGSDMVMAVYDGAGGCPGTLIDCDDDACAFAGESRVLFNAVSGSTYFVRVGTFGAAPSTIAGTVTIGPPPPAATCGDCAGADFIENEPDCGIATGCTGPDCDTVNGGCNSVPPAFSNISVGDSVCGSGAFNGAFRDTDWYMFTIGSATEVQWSVTAEFDVLVGFIDLNAGCPVTVFIAGTPVTAFIDGSGCATASTVACLPPGTYVAFVAPQFTVQVACGGGNGDYTGELVNTGGVCTAEPPANNNCADAIAVGDGSTGFDTTFSTTDGPASCGGIANDIWFLYTATTTGTTNAQTCGSAYDTVLAVYEVPCIGAELVCNDDTCGLQSSVSWATTSGQQYLIRIGGFFGATGTGTLTIGPLVAPTCGDCTGSETVDENELDCGIATGCTGPDCDTVNGGCNSTPAVFTSLECGDSVCGSGAFNGAFRDTDWYLFTISVDTQVTWSVTSEFDVLVGFIDLNAGCPVTVFIAGTPITGFIDGSGCASASTTACLAPGTYVAFVAPQFTAQVPCGGGFGDYTGSLSCDTCDLPDPPANDLCANAIAVAVPSSTSGTTIGSTGSDGAPACGPGLGTPGVWYSCTGTGSTMTASLCGSPNPAFDTVLSIYCGSCDALACVAFDDDACPQTGIGNSVVSWCSQAGANYKILVHSFGGTTDAFTLDVSSNGISCTAGVECLPTGACCQGAGVCTITTSAGCDALDGNYLGDGSTCTSTGTEFVAGDTPIAFPDLATVSSTLTIPSGSGTISGLRVRFSVTHTFIGDMTVTITNGTNTAELMNRVGRIGAGFGSGSDTVGPYTFFPGATGDIWAAAAASPVPAGSYHTCGADSAADTNTLAVFNGQPYAGTWTLTFTDSAGGDFGTVTGFAIEQTVLNNCDGGCPCDWNLDGELNSTDFFDFLEDFFAADADFNDDGETNSTDFFDFLECFFANAC